MPTNQVTCAYKRVNDCSVQADVYPAPVPHSPVVLYFHGGALIFGSRQNMPHYQIALLNEAGYTVVSADYRLAPETAMAEILTDVRDAIIWTAGEGAKLFGYDGTRLAIMGVSAGGYLALLSGTFEPKPQAIVSFYGYGDILGSWYELPSEHYCTAVMVTEAEALKTVGGPEKSSGDFSRFTYYLRTRQQGTWVKSVSGLDPSRDRERLLAWCPQVVARTGYPPAILLHGDADTDVPYEQSVAMHGRLRELNVESELVTMQGMGHGFDADDSNPEVQKALQKVIDFLQSHMSSLSIG